MPEATMWFMEGVSIRGKSGESGNGPGGSRLVCLFQVGKILPIHAIEGGEIEINKFVLSAYEL